jgi:hypothetical protein
MPSFPKDLTGIRFGRLVVLGKSEKKIQRGSFWNAQCDCGEKVTVNRIHLIQSSTKSCGCLYATRLQKPKDLTGLRFGRLVVTGSAVGSRYGTSTWLTKCDCGQTVTVSRRDLVAGCTISCGCRQAEIRANLKFVKSRLPNDVYGQRDLLRVYKRNARYRNLIFDLTEQEFTNITTSPCSYCGAPPSPRSISEGRFYLCNGIDRVDNARGYTTDNVVPCCSACNTAKGTLSKGSFEEWLIRVQQHFLGRKGPVWSKYVRPT